MAVRKHAANFIVSLLLTYVAFMTPAKADGPVTGQFDWTMSVQTERTQGLLSYKGSQFDRMVKATVKYSRVKESDKVYEYEKVWFNGGQPIALERLDQFRLIPGDGVCIQVKHASRQADYDETRAAAKLILRLFVDILANKNILVQVKVPTSSYTAIVNELQDRHCVRLSDDTNDSTPGLIIRVQSDSPGQSIRLAYQ